MVVLPVLTAYLAVLGLSLVILTRRISAEVNDLGVAAFAHYSALLLEPEVIYDLGSCLLTHLLYYMYRSPPVKLITPKCPA